MRHRGSTIPGQASPRILLVDDTRMFLEMQRHMLQPLSVQIATASDGREALHLVDEFGPDLIVLDANMPHMDGVACCTILKHHRRHRKIPVIMTVPNSCDNDGLCRAAGCEALLWKPLDAGIFLDAVTYFIPIIERRDRRVELVAPVTVKAAGRTFSGAILDISRSGARLEPDERVEVNAIVELAFTLPSPFDTLLRLHARVVRISSAVTRGIHAGAGVAFVSENGQFLRLPEDSPVGRYIRASRLHWATLH